MSTESCDSHARLNRTVFLIDDDRAVCHALSVLIEAYGYCIRTHHSAESFLEEIDHTAEGVILLDQMMMGMSGLELQAELATRGVFLPIIFSKYPPAKPGALIM